MPTAAGAHQPAASPATTQGDTVQRHAASSDEARKGRLTLYEQLGGAEALRAIIEAFIDRVRQDTMIGFLFRKVDAVRLKQKEFEFAAAHLGGPVKYTGQPLQQAHRKHPIMGGHFMRRLQILKETLQKFEVPPAVQDHWVANTLRLRPSITPDKTDECRGNPVISPNPEASGAASGREPDAPAALARAEPTRSPENSPAGAEIVKLRRP